MTSWTPGMPVKADDGAADHQASWKDLDTFDWPDRKTGQSVTGLKKNDALAQMERLLNGEKPA